MKKLLTLGLALVMVFAVGCQSTPVETPVVEQPVAPVEKQMIKFRI